MGGPAAYQAGAAPRPYYAGFWLRFVAHLLDGLIVGIPAFFVVLLVFGFAGMTGFMRGGRPQDGSEAQEMFAVLFGSAFLTFLLIAIVGVWLYYSLMESSSWQATLGKRAMGLMVTDMNGKRVTFGRATGRYFSKIITGLIPLFIGYIMAGFTEKKQALHDMIAACLVIRGRSA